jgi:hypothetical protein
MSCYYYWSSFAVPSNVLLYIYTWDYSFVDCGVYVRIGVVVFVFGFLESGPFAFQGIEEDDMAVVSVVSSAGAEAISGCAAAGGTMAAGFAYSFKRRLHSSKS